MRDQGTNVVSITPKITQRRLRMIAFARKFAETMDAGMAYRDIFRPATNPEPDDRMRGERMLRIKFVQKRVGEYLEPALVALGVDQQFAVRRLIETVDGDLTDFCKIVKSKDEKDIAALMNLEEMREALPLGKRRLVKKYKETFDQFGNLKTREIELESKQAALELLAKIRGWVSGDRLTVIDGEEMLRKIEAARHASLNKADAIRGEFRESQTFRQLQRPETVKLLQGPSSEEAKRG